MSPFVRETKGRRSIRSLLIETTTRAKCQRQLAGSAATGGRGNLLFNGLFHCTRLLSPAFSPARRVCCHRTDGKLRQTHKEEQGDDNKAKKKTVRISALKKMLLGIFCFSQLTANNAIKLSMMARWTRTGHCDAFDSKCVRVEH